MKNGDSTRLDSVEAHRIYTAEEVANLIRIPEEHVRELVERGDMRGIVLLDGRYIRITGEALLDLLRRAESGASVPKAHGEHLQPRKSHNKRRNPKLELEGRNWAITEVKKVVPDAAVNGRKTIVGNGAVGIMSVATSTSGPAEKYWFGFPDTLLERTGRIFLMPILADKKIAFLVPYDDHKEVLDGLSSDRKGNRKYLINPEMDRFCLEGKGVETPLDLSPYRNRFDRFAHS